MELVCLDNSSLEYGPSKHIFVSAFTQIIPVEICCVDLPPPPKLRRRETASSDTA